MEVWSDIPKGTIGIYKISIGKRIYIGQSVNIRCRVRHHICELRKNKHNNNFMQSVYNKHKEHNLEVSIVYVANSNLSRPQLQKVLTILEQTFINYYNAELNLQPAYISNLTKLPNPGIRAFKSTLFHSDKGYIFIKNLTNYCQENNLDTQLMKKVVEGKLDFHKGYFASEDKYNYYIESSKEVFVEEGLEIPLLYKDLSVINELTEEITNNKDCYLEEYKPWSNQEWVNDLFLKFVENKYSLNITQSLSESWSILKDYDVHGSRIMLEEEDKYIFHDVLNINLQSAYGSSLTRFDYPIGIPTIYANPNHKTERITLKQFMNLYSEELVEGLYTIYVSGFLSHKQNLVFSKYGLSSDKIGCRVLGGYYDDDDCVESHLGGKFILTSKQIELGIITSDILEVLKNVCTCKEYKEWMNLKVETAVYYPRSKELNTSDWSKSHSNSRLLGELGSHLDTRSRNWCRIPLKEFIGKLVDMRLTYKAKRYESPVFSCKQQLLKLIINTFYGDLASPFFPIGNTVVANNITASVRKCSWIMANALSCKFIVTDGGIYTPYKVPSLKADNKSFIKPGLHKLFTKEGRVNKSIEYINLVPESLENILVNDNAQELLDALALQHIHKFCDVYNLTFPFNIEHKLNHSSTLAVTNPYGKVDYILYTYKGEEVIKVRGVQPKEYDKHPKVEFIRALGEEREIMFHGAELIELVGVNQYIRTPHKYNTDLPGYEVIVEYIHKPNKNGGYIFETYDDFLKAEHAHKVRISRYERKYKDLVITLKPSFIEVGV